jgi:hypothetical protein
MAMLGIHGFLLLFAFLLAVPEPARRIGDSHHVLDDIAQT